MLQQQSWHLVNLDYFISQGKKSPSAVKPTFQHSICKLQIPLSREKAAWIQVLGVEASSLLAVGWIGGLSSPLLPLLVSLPPELLPVTGNERDCVPQSPPTVNRPCRHVGKAQPILCKCKAKPENRHGCKKRGWKWWTSEN